MTKEEDDAPSRNELVHSILAVRNHPFDWSNTLCFSLLRITPSLELHDSFESSMVFHHEKVLGTYSKIDLDYRMSLQKLPSLPNRNDLVDRDYLQIIRS